MDVGGWLRSLGLDEYEAAFRENKIDAAVLPKLTAEDLRDLGVAAVGDRRKLLEAIECLRSGTKFELTSSEASSTAAAPKDVAAERRQGKGAPAGRPGYHDHRLWRWRDEAESLGGRR